MSPFDRQVRAQTYRLLINGARSVDARTLAYSRGWDQEEIEAALARLESDHRIALLPGTSRVWMAHPFSGIDTVYRAVIGARTWFANCAWDALAVLGLLGDGDAVVDDLVWTVHEGVVQPEGLVHLVVPARHFWDDIEYT